MLSNKEVVDIVASAPARSSAASCLVQSAVKAWRLKYPTSRIDDCAVVCLFLNAEASNISSIRTRSLNATNAGCYEQESTSSKSLACLSTLSSNETLQYVIGEGPNGNCQDLSPVDIHPDNNIAIM